ncbi:uncharacterized protein DNG_05068 [Cephalotrichum gorgonifer]|uniref:Uncharacterized protein n=1 Tax=Cephalotrichum gorgonifer TaxID=2041049 RepID=A0AAE8N037_9PEZI|nr:uncharacterized protein DNG_05068 [Cephalotrichum gorgonifer]
MKPILKKTSHSEKNSLDLDRGWEDAIHYGNHGWGASGGSAGAKASPFTRPNDSFSGRIGAGAGTGAGGLGLYEPSRGGKDVSFSLSATDLNSGTSYGSRKYSHTRSASGTSHVSVATSASGPRAGGTFVHPFQQTPRASTPPLSYANSLASLDISNSHARDYSPTITEGDDDLDPHNLSLRNFAPQPPSLRRPSLASQRSDSQTDLPSTSGPLRVNTGLSNTTRLGQASRSDLRLNILSSTNIDSPTAASIAATTNATPTTTTAATAAPSQSLASPQFITSPTSSVAPSSLTSPIRSSLEMNFRLRSRSELDTAARQAQIREARRQFEDKEALKQAARDEKAARRRDTAVEREAQKIAKRQKHSISGGRNSTSNKSCSMDMMRPSYSRRDTANTVSDLASDGEKIGGYPPGAEVPGGEYEDGRDYENELESPRRVRSAKRRTASAWTSFILWLRTKLLKAGRPGLREPGLDVLDPRSEFWEREGGLLTRCPDGEQPCECLLEQGSKGRQKGKEVFIDRPYNPDGYGEEEPKKMWGKTGPKRSMQAHARGEKEEEEEEANDCIMLMGHTGATITRGGNLVISS